jgi:hypothetical protein
VARLRRAVGKLVAQHMADPALVRPAPRRNPEDRLMTLIAGIAMTDPGLSLRDVGAHQAHARANPRWRPHMVSHFREEATRSCAKGRGRPANVLRRRGVASSPRDVITDEVQSEAGAPSIDLYPQPTRQRLWERGHFQAPLPAHKSRLLGSVHPFT